MNEYIPAFIGHTIWTILDYFNIKLIFDKFNYLEAKRKNYNNWWLLYGVAVGYLYIIVVKQMYINPFVKSYRIIAFLGYLVFYFIYIFRMQPFINSKYGITKRNAAIYIYYEAFTGFLVQNIKTIDYNISNKNHVFYSERFVYDILVALVILIVLGAAYLWKYSKKVNIYFVSLSNWEYVLMIMCLLFVGASEEYVCSDDLQINKNLTAFYITIIAFGVMLIELRMILVKGNNTSMRTVINVLEEKMKILTNYYSDMNRKDEEFRRFRHDTKNMLIALQAMIKEGNNDKAVKYLDDMYSQYKNTIKKFDTGNFIADALLNTKSQVAEEYNTQIEINGFIPAEKVIDVDMVILLSNLLDNALEASNQLEGNKKIIIDSVIGKNMWCIEIKNPVSQKVSIYKNHINTSKENKEIHGYGLFNVEKVVQKYNGMLKLTCDDKEFAAKATLVLSK